jgi:hypothetical protein
MENWLSIAKQNGIKHATFLNRLCRGWSPERAATEPTIQQEREDRKWIDLAKLNGIKYNTYTGRVRKGWTPEKAATTPAKKKENRADRKWIKIAKDNGISRDTYRARVDKLGWSPEDAATKPLIIRDDQDWLKLALANGLSYSGYYFRVDELFWSPEEAATTPPLSVEEISNRSVENRKQYDVIRWERINKDPNNLFKFTPQHLERAANNGINECTFRSRIYLQGMTVQEAITTPLKNKKPDEYYEYLEMAKKNGVTYNAFRYRLKMGWSYRDAATKELQTPSKRRRPDAEWMDMAIENGIKEATYRCRIKRGWSPEEAASIPTLKNGEFLNEQTREKKQEGFKKFSKIKRGG